MSREYHAHGSIMVAGHRDAETADMWHEAVSKDFYEKYQRGRVTQPKIIEPHLKTGTQCSNSPRFKLSGSSSAQKNANTDSSACNGAALLGAKLQDQVGLWCDEEQQLLSAFCAVYGPEVQTIARLLCRGSNTGEIKSLIDKACEDLRCEVCQSPERGTEMILCDKCNLGFHIYCLFPALDRIPEDDWFCEDCCTPTTNSKNAVKPRSARYRAVAEDEEEPGRSMVMEGLEKQASEELQSSFTEVDMNKLLETLAPEMRKPKKRIRLRDVQLANFCTTLGVFLLTTPVPIRNEPLSGLVVPLRRHLRIVADAVMRSFDSLDVVNVREIVKAQRERRLAKDRTPHGSGNWAGPNDGFGVNRAWILQINPQFARIARCKQRGADLAWFARQYAHMIRKGDKLYIWTGSHVSISHGEMRPRGGGIFATAVVTAAPHALGDGHAALESLVTPAWRRLVPGVGGSIITFRILHVVQPMLTCRAMQNSARCSSFCVCVCVHEAFCCMACVPMPDAQSISSFQIIFVVRVSAFCWTTAMLIFSLNVVANIPPTSLDPFRLMRISSSACFHIKLTLCIFLDDGAHLCLIRICFSSVMSPLNQTRLMTSFLALM